jgi:hypothetical protein
MRWTSAQVEVWVRGILAVLLLTSAALFLLLVVAAAERRVLRLPLGVLGVSAVVVVVEVLRLRTQAVSLLTKHLAMTAV